MSLPTGEASKDLKQPSAGTDDFKLRVELELAELRKRLVKLTQFIATSPVFQKLGEEDKAILRMQSHTMDTYADILVLRLHRWAVPANASDPAHSASPEVTEK